VTKVGAHRGASGRAPENTLAAFKLALDEGAELLEFDVQLTRDQVAVVIHDEWVDRTSNGHGRVGELTYSELKQLDFGSYRGEEFVGCRIPTLDEVLELGKGRCQLNIEIKNGPAYYYQIEAIIIEQIKAHQCSDQVIISSFDHQAISRCQELHPEVRLAYLIAHLPLNISGLLPSFRLAALHPYYAYVNRELVKECHRLGLKVNVWGTNNPEDWQRLAKWEVDAIITDYVTELRTIIHSAGAE